MVKFYRALRQLGLETGGQDLIEYALLAATISMAAGAFLPQWVGPSICAIFSKVTSCLNAT